MNKSLIKFLDNKSLIIILIIAFILRAFHLNYDGLWNDEIYTAYTSNPELSISKIIHILSQDIHPPLHNFLNYFWAMLFGYNDVSLRILNMLFGFFAAVSVYHIARELFNKKVALYALCFAAINFYLIRYSQEVRAYSLLIILTNYSFYFFVKLTRDGFSKNNAIKYVLVTTAMVYTHYFALFVVGAQFFAFILLKDWKAIVKNLKAYLITFSLPLLLFLIWVPKIINNLGKERGGWRDAPELRLLFKYPRDFFNDDYFAVLALVCLFFSLLYLIIRKVIKLKKTDTFFKPARFGLSILVIWIVAFFMLPFLYSVFSKTILFNRYFLPIVSPILILLGYYLSIIKPSYLRHTIFVLLMGYSGFVLFSKPAPYYTKTHMYREAVQELKKSYPDAYVLHIGKIWTYYDYYLKQNRFKKIRKYYGPFEELINQDQPKEYFVLINLRPLLPKYKNGVPIIKGYKEVETTIYKNTYKKPCTKVIHYTRILE